MEAKRIHEDITQILYKIEDQYGRIIKYKDAIPLIEVDLIQKDIQELYECFHDLRLVAESSRRKRAQAELAKENSVSETRSEPEEKKSLTVEPEIPQPTIVEDFIQEESIELESISDESTPSIELPSKEEAEAVSAENDSNQVEEKKESIESEEIKIEPVISTPVPIAWQKTFDASQGQVAPAASPVSPKVDLLKEREKDFVPTVRKIEFKPQSSAPEVKKESLLDKAASLYDKIAKPGEKSPVTTAGRQSVSNIKAAIGINEKFTYLKELFKNNVAEYNEALDKLNDFENYADAEDFFQELKEKYNWDSESKSFQGLADLLFRRYLHNAG